jgi:hypothetical protein
VKTPDLILRVDDRVPVIKLIRALASHGLSLTRLPDGSMLVHDSLSVPPAGGALHGETPQVLITRPGIFTREWWRRT